jgi:hypothetical protein
MKIFIKTMLFACAALCWHTTTHAQTIGSYNTRTNTFTLTADSTWIKAEMHAELGNDGAQIQYLTFIGGASTGNKFLIGGPVQNDPEKIQFIAWELDNNNGTLSWKGRKKGGVTHSCMGDPCDSCQIITAQNGDIMCECKNKTGGGALGIATRCNHVVTVVTKG